MGAPVRFQKAVPGSKEKRRSGAPRGERPASLGVRRKAFEMLPAPFGAPLPSRFVRELSPRERGDGNSRRSPRLARTGAAELWLLHSPAVGSVNRMIAHERARAFWRNEPNALAWRLLC